MALGVKLLIGGVALATASCGGYFVYKKASDAGVSLEDKKPAENQNSDTSPDPKTPATQQKGSTTTGDTQSPGSSDSHS